MKKRRIISAILYFTVNWVGSVSVISIEKSEAKLLDVEEITRLGTRISRIYRYLLIFWCS